MSTFETLTLVLSLLAAVLSTVSLIRNRRNTQEVARLGNEQLSIQRALASLTLRRAKEEDALREKAHLTVRFSSGGGGSFDSITITNSGQAVAHNVSLHFHLPAGAESPLFDEELLPIRKLGPGQHLRLRAVTTNKIYPPWETTLSWDDPDGTQQSQDVLLSV